jgi:chemotaxis methyl-accepting protein methylase
MCCRQVLGDEQRVAFRITGTDISRNALTRARRAEYSLFEISDVPRPFRSRYLTAIEPGQDLECLEAQEAKVFVTRRRFCRVKEDIRGPVQFGFLNLNDPMQYWISVQDVIFCQNVLIYFSVEGRARIISMLLGLLSPGGYLFLGPGEDVGTKIGGAAPAGFENTMIYTRNQETVHVQVTR